MMPSALLTVQFLNHVYDLGQEIHKNLSRYLINRENRGSGSTLHRPPIKDYSPVKSRDRPPGLGVPLIQHATPVEAKSMRTAPYCFLSSIPHKQSNACGSRIRSMSFVIPMLMRNVTAINDQIVTKDVRRVC